MITAKHIVGTDVFKQLDESWDVIANQGITDTPFQYKSYQQIWWTHLGEGELHTIVVQNDDEVIAIAPLNLRGDVITFNASKEETDYLDIIVAEENAAVAWQAIFDCLCGDDFPAWNALDLYNIPAESVSRDIVATQAAQRGFSFATERAEVCPVIPLTGSFDEYLGQIDKKQRHEIRRKMRRAKGAEAEVVTIDASHDLTQAVNDFLKLLQSSTHDKNDWLNEARTATFHETAKAALAAGTLQLMFIEVDGQRAAALFNFVYKGRTWVYNSGLNPNAFGRLSLGVVLSAAAIQTATELGHHSFDFLRGDETYKYRFGAKDTEIFRLMIGRS